MVGWLMAATGSGIPRVSSISRNEIRTEVGDSRGELAADTSATAAAGHAGGRGHDARLEHALSTPRDRRADLARNSGPLAERLVDFLMRGQHPPAGGA